MAAHAREAAPREAVGVVLGTAGGATDYAPLLNVSPTPCDAFVVDPFEFVKIEGTARDHGLRVLGMFHSHPGGEPTPSAVDRLQEWPGVCCWIGTVRTDGRFDLGTFPLAGSRLGLADPGDQNRIV